MPQLVGYLVDDVKKVMGVETTPLSTREDASSSHFRASSEAPRTSEDTNYSIIVPLVFVQNLRP